MARRWSCNSDGRIKTDADFKGKKIATPQFGNTQARGGSRVVAVRKDLRITMTGGDALVVPTANPDQLSLFQKGDFGRRLDGRAVGEPLEQEAKGKVYLEESSLWKDTARRGTSRRIW